MPTADRYQVFVRVAASTLQDDDVSAETAHLGNADIAYLEHGPHVSAETSRCLACVARVVRLVGDENSEPLSIGWCSVQRWFDRYMPDLDIDADTCTAKWYAGDRMDWDLAVGHMFQ